MARVMGRPSSELLDDRDRAVPVSAVVSGLMDASASRRMSEAHRAWVAWQRANGDRERAHTVYVTVRPPRRGATDPVVVVGVDTHSFLSDVSANKEIYLARLENVGFAASVLEVRLARRRGDRPSAHGGAPARAASPRPLTEAERERVRRMVAGLPESIRANASKALEKSIASRTAW